jgi:GTPase SAR1 family protein
MKKVLKIDNKTVRVDLYDTAGTEIYKSIRSMYYQGAMGALLVYDVTQSDSFYDIKNFLD